MDIRIAGALFGFFLGATGYVITKYWILPIRHYGRLKARTVTDIRNYEKIISANNWNSNGVNKKRLKLTRQYAFDLVDCFTDDIPLWYRIKLKSRGESPSEAAQYLMGLGHVREAAHARKRLEKAKAALLIK